MRRILVCIAFAAILFGISPGQGFELVSAERSVEPTMEMADYYVSQVSEENPGYDGFLLIRKSDFKLFFALHDSLGQELWRKPVRSSCLLMADDAPRILELGKKSGEWKAHLDGMVAFRNVYIRDFDGNVVDSVVGTPLISGLAFTQAGDFVLYNYHLGLFSYNPSGKLLWQHQGIAREVQLHENGALIVLKSGGEGQYAIKVFEAETGNLLKEFPMGSWDDKTILYADREANQVFISEFSWEPQPNWQMAIYSTQTWNQTHSSGSLPYGIFSVDHAPNDDRYAFLARYPQGAANANTHKIVLGLWDYPQSEITIRELESMDFNLGRDHLSIDQENGTISIHRGKYISVYQPQH